MESACSSRSRPAHHPCQHHQQQEMYSMERRSFYVCTFCRRNFTSPQALDGHKNVHHRDRARLLLLTSSSTSSSSSRHLTPSPPPSPPRSDLPLDDNDDHHRHHHPRPTTLFVCRQLATSSSSSSSRSPARNPIGGKEDADHVVSLELGIGCKEDHIAAKSILNLELRLGCFTTI